MVSSTLPPTFDIARQFGQHGHFMWSGCAVIFKATSDPKGIQRAALISVSCRVHIWINWVAGLI